MNLIIRRVELKDVDSVCIMEEESFSLPWHRESFVEMINNRDALYLVAESKGPKEGHSTGSDNTDRETGAIDGNDDGDVIICGCAGFISVVGEGSICNIVIIKNNGSTCDIDCPGDTLE